MMAKIFIENGQMPHIFICRELTSDKIDDKEEEFTRIVNE